MNSKENPEPLCGRKRTLFRLIGKMGRYAKVNQVVAKEMPFSSGAETLKKVKPIPFILIKAEREVLEILL